MTPWNTLFNALINYWSGKTPLDADSNVKISSCNVIDDIATSTPLNSGQTYTSDWVDVSAYPSIVLAAATDQTSVMYIDFSTNTAQADSSIPSVITANLNDVHRYTVTRKYARVRITNTSAGNQTFLRMQALRGNHGTLTSSANSLIQDDADALLIRPLDFNMIVSSNLYQNRRPSTKDGINDDIDTASVPEDLWGGSGVYAGFPTTSPEAAEIVVAGADTGTVFYSYLASNVDTDYTLGSKAITGAATYALGHNIFRCNFAYFVGASGAINAGDITVRNTPTTTNIFCIIPANYGQSYCSAYTVPYGATAFLDRITANVRGATSATADLFLWWRSNGASPRLRLPMTVTTGASFFDDIDYLFPVPALTDIIIRCTNVSANNTNLQSTYRLVTVRS
jgi:hypothetical protein